MRYRIFQAGFSQEFYVVPVNEYGKAERIWQEDCDKITNLVRLNENWPRVEIDKLTFDKWQEV